MMTSRPNIKTWTALDCRNRDAAFNAWVRTQAAKKGFHLLPAYNQDFVRGLLKVAFQAGSNWQRRRDRKNAPIPMDQEAGTTLAQPASHPITPDATPVAQWPKNGGHEL